MSMHLIKMHVKVEKILDLADFAIAMLMVKWPDATLNPSKSNRC